MRVQKRRSLWCVVGLVCACSLEDRPPFGDPGDECDGDGACMSASGGTDGNSMGSGGSGGIGSANGGGSGAGGSDTSGSGGGGTQGPGDPNLGNGGANPGLGDDAGAGENGSGGSENGSGGSENGSGGSENGSGGASQGGSGGTGNTPPACDARALPAVDPCVIDESIGVFVAPTGNDASGNGSRARPFGTLTRAADRARAQNLRVYACATSGAFSELLQIDAGLDGITLFGGFSCADWSYSTNLRTEVLGPGPAALEVSDVTVGVEFQNFRFRASNAAQTGQSSIAARIVDSQNVRFVAVSFSAGRGANGRAGQTGAQGAAGLSPGGPGRGLDADCDDLRIPVAGPAGATNSCGSTSGRGGGTLAPPVPICGGGGTGLPGSNNAGDSSGDLGIAGDNGGNGAAGGRGTHAGASAGLGVFSEDGYAPATASNGGTGNAGQGGGGGGCGSAFDEVDFCRQALGGAGGLGGCGGQGGLGAQGGGASVALLSWNSRVSLNACALSAGVGGNGGAGGDGGPGGAGEAGATGGQGTLLQGDVVFLHSGDGGNGGRGGNGGPGGGGGGGAGGPSFGIVYSGTVPAESGGTTVTLGSGGTGGAGGLSANTRATAGTTGQAARSLAL